MEWIPHIRLSASGNYTTLILNTMNTERANQRSILDSDLCDLQIWVKAIVDSKSKVPMDCCYKANDEKSKAISIWL